MVKDKLIILDRDGVINIDSPHFVKSPEEWIPIPGSLEAIATLNHHGYLVMIASNQSGINRHLFTLEDLNNIHEKLKKMLLEVKGQIDGIYFCPHIPEDNCTCRKPKAGLLKQISQDFSIDLKKAYVVGDSLRDIQAGLATGATCFLVETGNGQKTLVNYKNELDNVKVFKDLSAVANYLISAK